jgi:hypothetical protein
LNNPLSQTRQYIASSRPIYLNTPTSSFTLAAPRAAQLTIPARTKLAPSTVRCHAFNGSTRAYATKQSSSSALVKYTPPTGPLDRVGRAKLLSAAPTFLERLKIRFKLLLMRQIRPWRVDDFIAMFSWAFIANIAFVLLGTTTFFSLVLAAANSLQFQGMYLSCHAVFNSYQNFCLLVGSDRLGRSEGVTCIISILSVQGGPCV